MELFELILVLLACVIISSPLEQILKRVALPLVQIGIGFAVALLLPRLADIHVDPELFLVLFIAPLLFYEARESTKADLWKNKRSILSLAIGLVLLTVLVVGFALHWMVPSIPLAAAFACAGALGPTDAAAVGALGQTVSLNRRQKTLLSGEALINDASGVVSFQFALAAVTTGTFSAVQAGGTFLVLFVGGILAGLVMGGLAVLSVALLRRYGYESTVVHVLYEVLTPFVVFLAAEELGVSGILAVVAAGLVMANTRSTLFSTQEAHQQVLSNGFWEVLVFLINGVLFVLLGMQLPQAFSPAIAASFGLPTLLGIMVVMTALVIGVRFAWIAILELMRTDPDTGIRGIDHAAQTIKDALVTTIAGPKGAVTLSIIFTIPLLLTDGTPFPNRALIIFLTAGTILLTLVVANIFLPILAPSDETAGEDEMLSARIAVLEATLKRVQTLIREDPDADYVPAMRLVAARYRSRLFQARLSREGCGDVMAKLIDEVYEHQQERADELQQSNSFTDRAAAPYYAILRGIRRSVGYAGKGTKVGSRFYTLRGQLALLWQRLFPTRIDDEESERIYYDTCLFAIDLERVAVDYLEGVIAEEQKARDGARGPAGETTAGETTTGGTTAGETTVSEATAASAGPSRRAEIAQVLLNEHQSVLRSLWGRINYGQEVLHETDMVIEHQVSDTLPDNMVQTFGTQFAQARKHADEADALALGIELDQIHRLRANGTITKQQAHELRESVYLMQMSLSG